MTFQTILKNIEQYRLFQLVGAAIRKARDRPTVTVLTWSGRITAARFTFAVFCSGHPFTY